MILYDLMALADNTYKEFQASLIPTVDRDKIIGVRIPRLRAYAKKIAKTTEAEAFLNSLPHTYYDENNLHAFLCEQIRDLDEAFKKTEQFLPYIDNWATCDSFNPKVFAKYPEKLLTKIDEWLASPHEYTVRYAIKLLMTHFLDERFNEAYMKRIAKIRREEYYIKMMIAWYFATAFAKQYETSVKYLENKELDPWVHNKAIQKATESFRVTDEAKKYLKTLRI